MDKVNLILGLQGLFDDHDSFLKLQQLIQEETDYTVPGCKYNYMHYRTKSQFEFEYCYDAAVGSKNCLGIDVHLSSNSVCHIKVIDGIMSDESAPYYTVESKKSGSRVPARLICSDVLPSLFWKDDIDTQAVLFSNDIHLCEKQPGGGHIEACQDPSMVRYCGKVLYHSENTFSVLGIEFPYYYIDLETDFGVVSLIVPAQHMDAAPEEDSYVCGTGILSLDVALPHAKETEDAFDEDVYDRISTDPGRTYYRFGFVPNRKNNYEVLRQCLLSNDHTRFLRCCANEIGIAHNTDVFTSVSKDLLPDEFRSFFSSDIDNAVTTQLLKCSCSAFRGFACLAVSKGNDLQGVIIFDLNDLGLVDKIVFMDPYRCELGHDDELFLLSQLGHAMCSGNPSPLKELLDPKCIYKSQYADNRFVGSDKIIKRLCEVAANLDETNQYTYTIVPTEEELKTKEDIPAIYHGAWCFREYQGGQENLAAVVFIRFSDEKLITNILLSRDELYLRSFTTDTPEDAGSREAPKQFPLTKTLAEVYGEDNTLAAMRRQEIPANDELDTYIWKQADQYSREWLWDNGYSIEADELEKECICYACRRKGVKYAFFVYAYGTVKTAQLDGEYCAELTKLGICQGRIPVVMYLKVERSLSDEGNAEYQVGRFGNVKKTPEPWIIQKNDGKDRLVFFPRKEIVDLVYRLIAAYNTQNLDVLKTIILKSAYIETATGQYHNDGFFSYLSHMFQNHGMMKPAFVRYNDVVYSTVPYIENYGYLSFSVNQDDRIDRMTMNLLDEGYRELVVLNDQITYHPIDDVPLLDKVDFLPPSQTSRFAIKLFFKNGEVRRYDVTDVGGEGPVVSVRGKTITDKIFQHGRVTDHLEKPEWMGYRNYPERGQGVEFINGLSFSTVELYHDSYPIERFDYSRLDAFVVQDDYSEDGFAVGRFSNMDPRNPLYLLDRNTMTATELPEEYQNTPIVLYHFCGGYSEGRVMVSLLGDIDLQYHHNFRDCAGKWGWLDKDLKEVIPAKYIYAMNFENGTAIVCEGEWSIDQGNRYWCDNERWGVIDRDGKEIVPCQFDELYHVQRTQRLYLVHTGGWEKGHYAVFDVNEQAIILDLDFDFDMGYMFNECYVEDGDILVFDEHLAGEGKDLITAYDLKQKKYLLHLEENRDRTYNGKSTLTVKNKQTGDDIIVF